MEEQYIKPDLSKNGVLGLGKYKQAHKVIRATENDYLFKTNIPIEDLAVISILNLSFIAMLNAIKELNIQHRYSINEPQLAPKLYSISFILIHDNKQYIMSGIDVSRLLTNTIQTWLQIVKAYEARVKTKLPSTYTRYNMYILEEKCGPPPTSKKIPIAIDDNYYNKINILIDNLIDKDNMIFIDFKPQNTCPKYDESGKLINIIGLDFDAQFMHKLTDIQKIINDKISELTQSNYVVSMELIRSTAKNYMFIQYYFMLLKFGRKLSGSDKLFIQNKIQEYLPQDKLLEHLSILYYIASYCIVDKMNENYKNEGIKYARLGDIEKYILLFYYVLPNKYRSIIYPYGLNAYIYEIFNIISKSFYNIPKTKITLLSLSKLLNIPVEKDEYMDEEEDDEEEDDEEDEEEEEEEEENDEEDENNNEDKEDNIKEEEDNNSERIYVNYLGGKKKSKKIKKTITKTKIRTSTKKR